MVSLPLSFHYILLPCLGRREEGSVNHVTDVDAGKVPTEILKRHPTRHIALLQNYWINLTFLCTSHHAKILYTSYIEISM